MVPCSKLNGRYNVTFYCNNANLLIRIMCKYVCCSLSVSNKNIKKITANEKPKRKTEIPNSTQLTEVEAKRESRQPVGEEVTAKHKASFCNSSVTLPKWNGELLLGYAVCVYQFSFLLFPIPRSQPQSLLVKFKLRMLLWECECICIIILDRHSRLALSNVFPFHCHEIWIINHTSKTITNYSTKIFIKPPSTTPIAHWLRLNVTSEKHKR